MSGEGGATATDLLGGKCRQCGFVYYPYQAAGCERCGAEGEALEIAALKPRGTVLSTVAIHISANPDFPAPFQVAVIRLDDGPDIRVLSADALPLAPGDVLVGDAARAQTAEAPSAAAYFNRS